MSKHFVGLDVSLAETSICVVDLEGRVVREGKVPTDDDELVNELRRLAAEHGLAFERIGIEACMLAQHLYGAMVEAGLPAICIETRHMHAVLTAQQLNKTDRNDARGIARMMRVGLYKVVHVKTVGSQRLRLLLSGRKLLQAKLLDVDNEVRGMLRNFGLKVGRVGKAGFEARVRELADGDPFLTLVIGPLLAARKVLREQFDALHRALLRLVRADPVCHRLMTMPGVGPVVAVTFRATVDTPARFARSRSIGPHLGLTPRRYQSGEIDRSGRISKAGDAMLRTALYEAAVTVLRWPRPSSLRAWAMRIVRSRGRKKALVALARRMGVILHRMWVDGTDFRWGEQPA